MCYQDISVCMSKCVHFVFVSVYVEPQAEPAAVIDQSSYICILRVMEIDEEEIRVLTGSMYVFPCSLPFRICF